MNSINRVRWPASVSVLMLLLGACGGPPKPDIAKAQLVVAADVNPDPAGRASPIVVRVYQLKEEGAFNSADFFAIFDKEQETLGPSLLAREEFELRPGEQRQLELNLAPDARFVGAIAAFRDIRNSKWKALSAAPEKELTDLLRKDKLSINVAKAAVTIAITD